MLLAPDPASTEVPQGFHPAVASWFAARFPEGPTEPQRLAWPLIASGTDTLVAAPTGSGKTLAGFLVAIDRLYRAHADAASSSGSLPGLGAPAPEVTRVVYVSPLRALTVDIAENLQRPLQEIAETAAGLGLDAPAITVGVRTGDTAAAERARMLRRPPSLVVTTPESLYLMVTSQRGRAALATVETVIVDEIHAVARDKRGAHLAVTLERLEALCPRRPVRIGLSATQRPIETVGRLLVGDRPLPATVDVGHRRVADLALELPGGELEAVASEAQIADVLSRIAVEVSKHRTTLVFVNTRRLAERFAYQLGELIGGELVAAHHGSLSKDRRYRVEARLRAGELKALVATASLELGIDVGPVELVCQIGSPRSIATFLQRVGRSNHSRSGTPKGRIYPTTRDELVECSALLMAVRSGELDAIVPSHLPLDIAAQQIVAEVASRQWRTDDLFALVRRAAPFAELRRESFDEIVTMLSDGITTGRGQRSAYLHHDAVNGELRPRRGARLAAVTSGGAIPETGDYRVLADPDDTLVGTVNEEWAVESSAGDIFLLGTHSWRIRRIEPGVVHVRDAGDQPPTVPSWQGEAPARTAELSAAVSAVRAKVEGHLLSQEPERARGWLCSAAGIGPEAAAVIVEYLAAGRAALGAMPTRECLVVERFFDDTGGMQLVLHSPHGGRVNRALGLALRKKFCRTFNFELQAAATDDAVILSLGPHHSFPLEEVIRYVRAATVRDTLEHAILDSPMFQSRWRWNLNRALIVLKFRGGRRNPPAIQRMESDDLMAAVFPQAAACQENITGPVDIPDHPLVRQTVEDTLREALDIEGVTSLLRAIEAGEVAVRCVDTTEASALAHEIVTARPYAFLDDEEFVNRRTNAVRLRRGLRVDLDSIGALDPEAIAAVHGEVAPVPQSADDLHDLLAATIAVSPRADWTDMYDQLVARGRATTVEVAAGRWSTTEHAEVAAAAYNGDQGAAVRVVRGHLEISGIVTADELAAATGLASMTVTVALAALQADGFALQGRWRASAGEGTLEWVARRLLARMHASSRRSRRGRVEAASAQDFLRFLLRWQHVAPGTQLAGDNGLVSIIEQLQGFEAAAVAWEPELLARRLRGYDPAWLDRLCHDGSAAWLRLIPPVRREAPAVAAAPSKATPIAVVFRNDLPWLLAAARSTSALAAPELGATAEIAEQLARRGASFPADLAVATRRSPDDVVRGLWDGVARGMFMCDGFSAIRTRMAPPPMPSRRMSRLGRAARIPVAAAGRWSLTPGWAPRQEALPGRGVPATSQGPAPVETRGDVGVRADIDDPLAGGVLAGDRDELAEAVAEQLLTRWGVVFRDLAGCDSLRLPWRDLTWALRRLEDRGLVHGGRFVAGFAGEQYALPEAAEQLLAVRDLPRCGEQVTINAADPLNLVGSIVAGPPVRSLRTRTVTYIDGVPAST
ncbi:DEAD/DEAH box helicase [Acidiferrimicrobium sp. IK]|uniref:DEAD/DEAH box helicase n=1 Tax=Acidiferrimicrobium sp. IK TaxID=2871700 RepID=UPI0021CB8E12|nr:DEAD/DEAH box helicase [Acidiferrimicrobium sp. IK]MCU4184451.1 DEAD/DEAH box helicase [Acidiferrimicrobium sp. IK]